MAVESSGGTDPAYSGCWSASQRLLHLGALHSKLFWLQLKEYQRSLGFCFALESALWWKESCHKEPVCIWMKRDRFLSPNGHLGKEQENSLWQYFLRHNQNWILTFTTTGHNHTHTHTQSFLIKDHEPRVIPVWSTLYWIYIWKFFLDPWKWDLNPIQRPVDSPEGDFSLPR